MIQYTFKTELPSLKCLECGNTTDFNVIFNESVIEIEFRAGKHPEVIEWIDTGKNLEVNCLDCGSQDIEVDETFFG